jgi:hypothetical protein
MDVWVLKRIRDPHCYSINDALRITEGIRQFEPSVLVQLENPENTAPEKERVQAILNALTRRVRSDNGPGDPAQGKRRFRRCTGPMSHDTRL